MRKKISTWKDNKIEICPNQTKWSSPYLRITVVKKIPIYKARIFALFIVPKELTAFLKLSLYFQLRVREAEENKTPFYLRHVFCF